MLSGEAVFQKYREAGAVWEYDYRRGDPTLPHAALTSELCTDGYMNSDLLMCEPVVVTFLASELIGLLETRNAVLPVDWVVGSAYGGITFSFEVARQLGARHGFVKKDPKRPGRMVWEGAIPGGALVLRCEELVTTAGTAVEVERAVQAGNANGGVRFLPDVATIIYRPNKLQGGLIDVITLTAKEMQSWPQAECPLCKQGSPRLRPKANWRELTGK